MAVSSLEKAILLTVAYTQQFQYPLSREEITSRLIARETSESNAFFDSQKVTQKTVIQTLNSLVKRKKLLLQKGWYFLPGKSDCIETRTKRSQAAAEKWQEVEFFVKAAQKISWIEAIFITGSLAMNNTRPEDDVDFMIVTQPHRLWLTRLWVTWFAWQHGKRRSWHGEEKRSWCFNLWVTSDSLPVFTEKPSLYVAYELLQTRCVFDRTRVEERLLKSNHWALEFLPLGQWKRGSRKPVAAKEGWFGTVANYLAYAVQWVYMRPHVTRERVTLKWAFFHPRDTEAGIG